MYLLWRTVLDMLGWRNHFSRFWSTMEVLSIKTFLNYHRSLNNSSLGPREPFCSLLLKNQAWMGKSTHTQKVGLSKLKVTYFYIPLNVEYAKQTLVTKNQTCCYAKVKFSSYFVICMLQNGATPFICFISMVHNFTIFIDRTFFHFG